MTPLYPLINEEDMERMDESLARKVLDTHKVEHTELAVYDVPPGRIAYIIDSEGTNVFRVRPTSRMVVDPFTYKDSPEAVGPEKAIQSRIKQEEEILLALLDAASSLILDGDIGQVSGPLSKELVANAVSSLESHDVRASNLIISPKDVPRFEEALGLTFEEDTTFSEVVSTSKCLGLHVYAHPRCISGRSYLLQEGMYLGSLSTYADRDKCGIALLNVQPVVRLNF